MTEHYKSRVYATSAEAKTAFDQFQAELDDMIQRYGLHGCVFAVSASIDEVDETGENAVVGTGMVSGCRLHTFAFLSRFLADTLNEHAAFFLAMLQQFMAKRMDQETPPQPAPEPETKLLTMPLPKGHKWAN